MPQYKQFPKQFPVLLTQDQWDWLEAEGKRLERPAASLVRQAIDDMRQKPRASRESVHSKA